MKMPPLELQPLNQYHTAKFITIQWFLVRFSSLLTYFGFNKIDTNTFSQYVTTNPSVNTLNCPFNTFELCIHEFEIEVLFIFSLGYM